MVEHDLEDDPYAKKHFSRLAKKIIENAKKMFDSPVKEYLLFKQLEKGIKDRKVDVINGNQFADLDLKIKHKMQSYYGLLMKNLNNSNIKKPQKKNG